MKKNTEKKPPTREEVMKVAEKIMKKHRKLFERLAKYDSSGN